MSLWGFFFGLTKQTVLIISLIFKAGDGPKRARGSGGKPPQRKKKRKGKKKKIKVS